MDTLDTGVDENSTAILIFTSGTTGTPKAVPISHKNILTNARDAMEAIEASEQDRLVSVLPLSHMFEFTAGFVTSILPKGKSVPGPGKLRLFFGKPISYQHLKREQESYRRISEELQKQVATLEALAKKSH